GPGGGWPRCRRGRWPVSGRSSRSEYWRQPSSARGGRRRAGAPVGGGCAACVGSAGGGHWRSLEDLLAANTEGRQDPRLFAKTRGFSSLRAPISLGLRLVEG